MATADQIGQVRLLVADTDPDQQAFTDAEIDEFLSIESDHVRRAAALALETYAVDLTVKVGAVRGVLDAQLDAGNPVGSLLAMAKQLRSGSGVMRAAWLSQFTAAEEAGG